MMVELKMPVFMPQYTELPKPYDVVPIQKEINGKTMGMMVNKSNGDIIYTNKIYNNVEDIKTVDNGNEMWLEFEDRVKMKIIDVNEYMIQKITIKGD